MTVLDMDRGQGAPPEDESATPSMKVRKRDGSLEPVDVNKIVRAVSANATAPA